MADNEHTMISEEAFEEHIRNYVAANPSQRNPQINKESSHPDRIEAAYQAYGHTTWGYVIYRTTYESDADWAELKRRLRYWAEASMDFFNGRDVLDKMAWTIFDDRDKFDGADVAMIRRHFRIWAEGAVQSEQPRQSNGAPADMGRSPRYRYCMQVDSRALHSCVYEAPSPPQHGTDTPGWVKLIDANWMLRSENPIFAGRQRDETAYDEIEGVTEYDVGWVKCPFTGVMVEYYMLLQDPNGYVTEYRRPPALVA